MNGHGERVRKPSDTPSAMAERRRLVVSLTDDKPGAVVVKQRDGQPPVIGFDDGSMLDGVRAATIDLEPGGVAVLKLEVIVFAAKIGGGNG